MESARDAEPNERALYNDVGLAVSRFARIACGVIATRRDQFAYARAGFGCGSRELCCTLSLWVCVCVCVWYLVSGRHGTMQRIVLFRSVHIYSLSSWMCARVRSMRQQSSGFSDGRVRVWMAGWRRVYFCCRSASAFSVDCVAATLGYNAASCCIVVLPTTTCG